MEITGNSSFLRESYVKMISFKAGPTADKTSYNLETYLLIQGFVVLSIISILLAAIYWTVKTDTISNGSRSGFSQKALVLTFFLFFLCYPAQKDLAYSKLSYTQYHL